MKEATQQRGVRKELVGEVVSDRPDKTIVVKVTRRTAHPMYQKVISDAKKFYAHDPQNEAHTGDVVRIMETRPLSKLKRWRLVAVVRRAGEGAAQP